MAYAVKDVPPQYMQRWQRFADLTAEAADVPAALVMRVWPEQIEVLVSSVGDDNPYEEQELADLGTGLYCETVMSTRQMLQVPDALADVDWENNPDIKLGMISYLGLPLVWPDDTIFGTVCVLDANAHVFEPRTQGLLRELKAVIERDFQAIYAQGTGPDDDDLAERFERAARQLMT